MFVTLPKLSDFALYSLILWILYAEIYPVAQALLWLVGVVLVIYEEFPPLWIVLWN